MLASLFHAVLMLTAVMCSLVAGFLFAFAVVVMPGIGRLDDLGFIRAFQAIDRVIQNNQPLFMLVWIGSVLAAVVAGVLGLWLLSGVDRVLVVVAALGYVLGVQASTGMVNIPLNNQLQRLDAAAMTDAKRRQAREAFEPRWNRWNVLRTVVAITATTLWLLVLLRQ